jgi:hypothetical protein
MKIDEVVFIYIGKRVEFDNILPCEDDIYTEFQNCFEIMGYSTDIIEEMIDQYVSCSDITGVQIEWEGELNHEARYKRVEEITEISPKTA